MREISEISMPGRSSFRFSDYRPTAVTVFETARFALPVPFRFQLLCTLVVYFRKSRVPFHPSRIKVTQTPAKRSDTMHYGPRFPVFPVRHVLSNANKRMRMLVFPFLRNIDMILSARDPLFDPVLIRLAQIFFTGIPEEFEMFSTESDSEVVEGLGFVIVTRFLL